MKGLSQSRQSNWKFRKVSMTSQTIKFPRFKFTTIVPFLFDPYKSILGNEHQFRL